MDPEVLAFLNEHKDEYEFLLESHDPYYDDELRAIEIVKEFISKNNLVIYGGVAVDWALRLRGSSIYSDIKNAIPDLDFYSPQNIEHAYDLADIFYEAEFIEARAINGIHTTTMKVDIGGNHFVADISYCIPKLFEHLPTLIYNGMKIIHPLFQLIDYHSAMSFLYDENPREVVFNRLLKDMKRSNLLLTIYPPSEFIDHNLEISDPGLLKIKHDKIKKYVYTGHLAYSIYYHIWRTQYREVEGSESKEDIKSDDITLDDVYYEPIEALFSIEEIEDKTTKNKPSIKEKYILFSGKKVEMVNFNILKQKRELGLDDCKHYKAYHNLIPERLENDEFILYSTKDKLLSVNTIKIMGISCRVVCFNYLLRHFIALYNYETDPVLKNEYLSYYDSLLSMIPQDCDRLVTSPFYISVDYYGADNKSPTYYKQLSYVLRDLGEIKQLDYPANYMPDKNAKNKRPRPTIDTTAIKEFNKDGSCIEEEK